MLLRRQDFAGWRINWADKAANLVELVEELNLGLASVVFIDDNPAERGRISEALPEVLVPDWPADPALYVSTLQGLRCFDAPSVEAEDRARTAMYVADRERRASRPGQAGSLDDWLRSLDLQVTAEPLSDANLARAAQLFNKTNQMNLATRRLSEGELRAWASRPGCSLWTYSVADRFGASGLTGIVSVQVEGDQAEIVDFILSCRVMGRKIEETMLHVAVAHARRGGATQVRATYLPTPRNGPCLAFWNERSGFRRSDGSGPFVWDAGQAYPMPDVVTLHLAAAAPR
jgi:FkbH-like protein